MKIFDLSFLLLVFISAVTSWDSPGGAIGTAHGGTHREGILGLGCPVTEILRCLGTGFGLVFGLRTRTVRTSAETKVLVFWWNF